MVQRITLASDGTLIPKRMQAYTTGQATNQPAIKMSRLRQLLASQEPRICIVRGEGIGDVLTTTPTVRAIREQFKKVHITYATNTRYLDGALVSVLKYNPDIDEIIERHLLTDTNYDLVINLHCPCIAYEVPGNPPVSRIDLFARSVGITLRDPIPKFYFHKRELEAAETLMAAHASDKIILVQPTASARRRSVPHLVLRQAAVTLYERYNIRSLFITHSGDPHTDVQWKNIPGAIVMKDLDIRQIAAVAIQTNLILCPDSSLLHLSAAIGVPAVALLGPSHPTARIGHYPLATAVWGGEGLAPCPCYYSECPIREVCWDRITVEKIVDACLSQMSETKRFKPSIICREDGIKVKTEYL